MKKGFGSRVFRNPHGRLLEKNLVEFTPSIKTLYGNDVTSFEGEQYWSPVYQEEENIAPPWNDYTFSTTKYYYHPRPNKCLVSFASYKNLTGRRGAMNATKDVMICHSQLSNVTVKEHDLDPIIISVDTRLGAINNAHLEGSTSIRRQVVESLKTGFNDDYCFHRPASVRFSYIAATSCEVDITAALDVIGIRTDLSHKLFLETDSFDMTTCDAEALNAEIDLLKTKEAPGYMCHKVLFKDNSYDEFVYEATTKDCSTFESMQSSSKQLTDDGLRGVDTSSPVPGMYIEYLPGFMEQFDASEFPQLSIVKDKIKTRIALENDGHPPGANM